MSAKDRLVQPGACSWCSHPSHPDRSCETIVDYGQAKTPDRQQCRCQKER